MPVGVSFNLPYLKGELKTSKSDFCPHFGGKFPTVHWLGMETGSLYIYFGFAEIFIRFREIL